MEFNSVTEIVVGYLRSNIVTGNLKAGQKIKSADLIAELDVSTPPIREALRILENENLVFSIPRKGAYVSKLSLMNLQNLYQAREMLECYAIRLLKEKNIRKLPEVASFLSIDSSRSMPSQHNSEELLSNFKAHWDYHLKLLQSSGNELIVHIYNSIYFQLARYQIMHFHIAGIEERIKEHHDILEFIKLGSYSDAEEKLRSHIRNTFKNLKARILKMGF